MALVLAAFLHLCREREWKKNRRRRHVNSLIRFWCSLSQKSDMGAMRERLVLEIKELNGQGKRAETVAFTSAQQRRQLIWGFSVVLPVV